MKCERCKCDIRGGENPTGFAFPPFHAFITKCGQYNICRFCYNDFYDEFNKIAEEFFEVFLNEV